MKGSMRIPVAIVFMLIVFIIVLAFLYKVLGSPECDDISNTTAFHLKDAVNQVSKEDFPYWTNPSKPPEEGDVAYYRRSDIKLCQQNFGTYEAALRLFGGEPEYKIYYEKFPDEGRMWKESYPWNCGAGSTLVFWGIMHTATTLVKVGSKVFTYYKYGKQLAKTASIINKENYNLFDKIFRPGKIMGELKDAGFTVVKFVDEEGRSVIKIADDLNVRQLNQYLKGLGEAGIATEMSGNYIKIGDKIRVSDELTALSAMSQIPDPVTGEYSDYAFAYKKIGNNPSDFYDPLDLDFDSSPKIFERAGDGSWIDTETGAVYDPLNPGNYPIQQYRPSELMESMIQEYENSPDPTERSIARQLREQFDTSGAAGTEIMDDTTSMLDEGVKATKWGVKSIDAGSNNFANLLSDLKTEGFNIEKTPLLYNELYMVDESGVKKGFFMGLQDAADSDSTGVLSKQIMNALQDQDDKIGMITSKNPADVNLQDAIDSLLKNTNGMYNPDTSVAEFGAMIFPGQARINAYVGIDNSIISQLKNVGGTFDPVTLVSYVENLPNYDELAKAGLDSGKINSIYNDIWAKYQNLGGNINPGSIDNDLLMRATGDSYFSDFANAAEDISTAGNKWAENDKGVVIGIWLQNSKPWYIRWSETYKKYEKIPKAIWFKARQMITPTSGIGRGFILGKEEGCQGNSLCVYSHGSLSEYPFYFDESADKYFVRVWRPVTAFAQYAGWTAILYGVPEHPRFYVVGPCFAEARVWKTRYNGEDTIFVQLIRHDLGDKASNYCYADENLINAYAAVWLVSDAATAADVIYSGYSSFGKSASDAVLESAKSTAKGTIGNFLNWLDIGTLVQVAGEYQLSWPGQPFKPLTWEQFVTGFREEQISEAEEAKKAAGG